MRLSGAVASATSSPDYRSCGERSVTVIARVRIAFLPWVNDVDVTFVVTPDRHGLQELLAVPHGYGNFKFAPLRPGVFRFENLAHWRRRQSLGHRLVECFPVLRQHVRLGGFWVNPLVAQISVKIIEIVLAGEV